MHDFTVWFQDAPGLRFALDDTDLCQRWLRLMQQQYLDDPVPIFRDPALYTLEHFAVLAEQAQQKLGWNWVRDHYDLAVTTRLHKDIEQFLEHGYSQIPEEFDHLLHELHFALHSIENGGRRGPWLQIEWYNDAGFVIHEHEYPGRINLEFGDLRLQNPYVGHHPLFVYQQQDNIHIDQTCRFHDMARPGFNIVVESQRMSMWDPGRYLDWFRRHAPEWVLEHGEQRLMGYTGHPVIGRCCNVNDLVEVMSRPGLRLQGIEFE
jgi:hypothetical protein